MSCSRAIAATILFGTLASAGTSAAQTRDTQVPPTASHVAGEPGGRLQLGIGGLFGAPSGAIGDTVGRVGGVGFDFGFRFRRVPLVLLADVQIQQYSIIAGSGVVPNVTPEFVIEPPAGNAAGAAYFVTRLQARRSLVKPYVDGAIGIHWTGVSMGEDVDTPAAMQQRTLGVGVGGGVLVRLARLGSSLDFTHLDLRARYMYAGAATALTHDLVVVRASTHMLQGYVGILILDRW